MLPSCSLPKLDKPIEKLDKPIEATQAECAELLKNYEDLTIKKNEMDQNRDEFTEMRSSIEEIPLSERSQKQNEFMNITEEFSVHYKNFINNYTLLESQLKDLGCAG